MSHRVFCPHCDVKLKFKNLPREVIDCPKCQQPIEPAHFQSAVEATAAPVEDATPADPVPPGPSDAEESETYSFSAPAPKPTPARSAVEDDLSERIERQSKPKNKKKKKRKSEEEHEEESMITAGLSGLVGAAFFLIYGGMGWGITFLHIIDFSPGFIFGTGVVLGVLSGLMLLAGIYQFVQEGFEATGEERAFFGKAALFVLAIAGLVPLIIFSQRGGDESSNDTGNETAAAANNEGYSTSQRAKDSNPSPPETGSNGRRTGIDQSAGSSLREQVAQAAKEEGELPAVTVLLRADKHSQKLVDFVTLLRPREDGVTVEIIRETGDYMMFKLRPVADIERFAARIKPLGFDIRNLDLDNGVVEFGPPPLDGYHTSQSHLFINPSIFKNLPDIPYGEMLSLNEDFPGAEFTPIVGRRSRHFKAPNLLGETERMIRGGTCRTNAMYGKLYLDDIQFSAFPRNYEPKDRRLRSGEIQEKNFGAKDGYVVTGLNVALDEGIVRGIQPLFTRINESEIDSTDTYVGDWMGLHEDLQTTTLGGHKQAVLGITCFGESSVAGIGLILQPAETEN